MYTILKSRIHSMESEVMDFLIRLLETPSTSTQEERLADLVFEEMTTIGFDNVYRDDAGNVIGVMHGVEGAPTVVLNSHMDTVNLHGAAHGAVPIITSSDKRVYGVGASDCKGGLAAQVYAGALLKRCLLPFAGNLVVAATVAEENGCSIGVRELLETTMPALGLNPDYVILGEPTDLGLYYGHDGRIEFDIKVEGQDPDQVNFGARAIYQDLGGNDVQTERVHSNGLSCIEPEVSFSDGRQHARIHVEKKLFLGENATTAAQLLKHETDLLLKTETALAVDVAVAVDEQRLFCGKKTLVKHVANAWQTDPYDPLMERARQALAAAGCEVKTGKWQLDRPGMGTAGSVIRNEFNLPVIGYGPGEEDKAHREDESVGIGNVMNCIYGTASIVHGLVGIPVFGWTSDEI